MLTEETNIERNSWVIDILTVPAPPVKLDFFCMFNCPFCDSEIDVYDMYVDDDSYITCELCDNEIRFKIIRLAKLG